MKKDIITETLRKLSYKNTSIDTTIGRNKIADELLKEDEEKIKKHKQERRFALKDDSHLFFMSFIEAKYGYKKNRKCSYFSEYHPNGLTFVRNQNLQDLIFDNEYFLGKSIFPVIISSKGIL